MEYRGIYNFFDSSKIEPYPISKRTNKVKIENLVLPDNAIKSDYNVSNENKEQIEEIAEKVVQLRKESKPVILFTGAHSIKNGLGPLIADLVRRDILTLVAGNGATTIHDFELALIGETSEYVPMALEKGQFGMAYEFAYINAALSTGNKHKLGYGETLGRMICDKLYRDEILKNAANAESPREFKYPHFSVLAACYDKKIPFTVHVGIGTDVIDQHHSFDGQAKGGCSGRDFLIYTNQATRFTKGGMVFNIGSAVTGPEVLLKAVSMAANTGFKPDNLMTADFDVRQYEPSKSNDEASAGYYFRDQKSVVTRIPQAFNGKGYYVQGNQKQTFPLLYKKIIEKLI
ncbi:MAG: hypothetical protein A2Y12_09145 [Planctomycetes bacterium GWF2_42_9]|nr:MAG: hypothetical protein A2Y12_09145 [Planctomycetes bacterium GWF2_42_9]